MTHIKVKELERLSTDKLTYLILLVSAEYEGVVGYMNFLTQYAEKKGEIITTIYFSGEVAMMVVKFTDVKDCEAFAEFSGARD